MRRGGGREREEGGGRGIGGGGGRGGGRKGGGGGRGIGNRLSFDENFDLSQFMEALLKEMAKS